MIDPTPLYDFKECTEDIPLASGILCLVERGQVELKGVAEIWLSFLPRSGIYITMECDFEAFKHFNSILSGTWNFSLIGHDIRVFATSIGPPTSGKTHIIFTPHETLIPLIGDKDTELSKMVFHLFNFKDIIGTYSVTLPSETGMCMRGVTVLKSAKWELNLFNYCSSKTKERLDKTGGYALTHIAALSRSDGRSFKAQEAEDLMGDLYLFFTFCQGSFLSPTLPVGFDESGQKVWVLLNNPHQLSESQFSWFDPHHCDEIAALFPDFLSLLENEDWKDTLHTVIYWYARSNDISGQGVDTGIVLTQIAIEHLSFEYTVNQKKLLDAEGFKKLVASNKFRILLSSLNLPLDIPDTLPHLKKLAKKYSYTDAAHVLTAVRNSMVHSEHKREENSTSIYYEAWLLGLWYLELSILRLCSYQGTYANRVVKERWLGTVEKVPWEIKHENT